MEKTTLKKKELIKISAQRQKEPSSRKDFLISFYFYIRESLMDWIFYWYIMVQPTYLLSLYVGDF